MSFRHQLDFSNIFRLNHSKFTAILNEKFSVRYHQHPFEGFNGQSCGSYHQIEEDISAACFVPLQKSLIENDNYGIFLVLSYMFGYLEQKLLGRSQKSLVFPKSNFFGSEKFQVSTYFLPK
jgi:hypothetical protein